MTLPLPRLRRSVHAVGWEVRHPTANNDSPQTQASASQPGTPVARMSVSEWSRASSISELIESEVASANALPVGGSSVDPDNTVHPARALDSPLALMYTNKSVVSVGLFRRVFEQFEQSLAPVLGTITASTLQSRMDAEQQSKCVAAQGFRELMNVVSESVKPERLQYAAGLDSMEITELRRQLSLADTTIQKLTAEILDLNGQLATEARNNELIAHKYIRVSAEQVAMQQKIGLLESLLSASSTEKDALHMTVKDLTDEIAKHQDSLRALQLQMNTVTSHNHQLGRENVDLRCQMINGDARKLRFAEEEIRRLRAELRCNGTALHHLMGMSILSKYPQDQIAAAMAGECNLADHDPSVATNLTVSRCIASPPRPQGACCKARRTQGPSRAISSSARAPESSGCHR